MSLTYPPVTLIDELISIFHPFRSLPSIPAGIYGTSRTKHWLDLPIHHLFPYPSSFFSPREGFPVGMAQPLYSKLTSLSSFAPRPPSSSSLPHLRVDPLVEFLLSPLLRSPDPGKPCALYSSRT